MAEENRNLNENSVNDKDLGKVTGGTNTSIGDKKTIPCHKCHKSNNVHLTGKTKSSFFGLFKMYEWHCGNCGNTFWDNHGGSSKND